MGLFLNPGNDAFKSSVNSRIYVDKTDLISFTNGILDTEEKYICVSRPRRFGKSMAADMLSAYYSRGCDSKELFAGLKIAGSPLYYDNINKYDVIHLDIQWFRSNARIENKLDSILTKIQDAVLDELRAEFPECGIDNVRLLTEAVSRVYASTGRKFIIIIDEWDCLFREEKNKTSLQEKYIDFLRGLFKGNMADSSIALAYITGILPVKKYGVESALNNFEEYTMIDPGELSDFVGFTEDEVRQLCKKYSADFEELRSWYDGYRLGTSDIYNPKSVVSALLRKRCRSYWAETETYTSLKNYIDMNFDGLKDAIVAMMSGYPCKIDTGTFENDMVSFKSKDDVLTLLIHLGYLSYDYRSDTVFIPNEEIAAEFARAVKMSKWNAVSEAIARSDELLDATLAGDSEKVARMIDDIHTDNISILAYNDENSLSCVISLAYYSARKHYTLKRECPAGKGFADIAFVPKPSSGMPPMIVELKWDKNARTAIDQIKDREYYKAFSEYKGKILLVGISYDRASKHHGCIIETTETE